MITLLFVLLGVVSAGLAVLAVWMIVTAQKQNRAMGIPPLRFNILSMLISVAVVAIMLAFVVFMVKSSIDPTR